MSAMQKLAFALIIIALAVSLLGCQRQGGRFNPTDTQPAASQTLAPQPTGETMNPDQAQSVAEIDEILAELDALDALNQAADPLDDLP